MKRCGECGSTNIVLKSARGKTFPHKEYRAVPLLFDYDVRTCENCGNLILSNTNIWELNELIEKSIQLLVQKSINAIVEHGLNQVAVAQMLGQTPQYISYLKAGSKTPSFATLSLLRIYAKYPAMIEEFAGIKTQQFNVENVEVVKKDDSLAERIHVMTWEKVAHIPQPQTKFRTEVANISSQPVKAKAMNYPSLRGVGFGR